MLSYFSFSSHKLFHSFKYNIGTAMLSVNNLKNVLHLTHVTCFFFRFFLKNVWKLSKDKIFMTWIFIFYFNLHIVWNKKCQHVWNLNGPSWKIWQYLGFSTTTKFSITDFKHVWQNTRTLFFSSAKLTPLMNCPMKISETQAKLDNSWQLHR